MPTEYLAQDDRLFIYGLLKEMSTIPIVSTVDLSLRKGSLSSFYSTVTVLADQL